MFGGPRICLYEYHTLSRLFKFNCSFKCNSLLTDVTQCIKTRNEWIVIFVIIFNKYCYYAPLRHLGCCAPIGFIGVIYATDRLMLADDRLLSQNIYYFCLKNIDQFYKKKKNQCLLLLECCSTFRTNCNKLAFLSIFFLAYITSILQI